jgi:hypothetical protein
MADLVESLADATYSPDRLLGVALELERWILRLPVWRPLDQEPWSAYAERLRRSEEILASKLRHLPSCRLALSDGGQEAELSLAGLHVRSSQGLSAACQLWIRKAKKQATA